MAYIGDQHPVAVGDRTTAMVLARLLAVYPMVLRPFGENQRYDLLIEDGEHFIRVQCKTGRLRDGVIHFKSCSFSYHHPNNRGTVHYQHDYRGQAEVFGIYCPETDGVYMVPVEAVGVREGVLRVTPTKNSQSKKVRWARDFELKSPG